MSSLDNSRKNKCILETYLQLACFELRAVTASSLVGRRNTQLIILCPQTDSILLDSNDDEEMTAPVNTGQLIYCSELILAHQKTFTELTSLIILCKVENN